MRVTVEATPEELALEGEMLAAHIAELLAPRDGIRKSAAGVQEAEAKRKPHSSLAMRQMVNQMRQAYAGMLEGMKRDIVAYLSAEAGKEPY